MNSHIKLLKPIKKTQENERAEKDIEIELEIDKIESEFQSTGFPTRPLL